MEKESKVRGVLKNEILKNISYLLKLEKNLGEPAIQQIESTNACMMNCIMCPRKNMKRKIGFMELKLFKKIVSQLKWNDELWLHHFGDPLMHPKIVEMINYVSGKGIKAKISINPNLLSENMSKALLKSGLHTLMISLDGIDNKTYKYFRGRNADYDDAIKKIDRFLELKRKFDGKVRVVMSMIRMKLNKGQDEIFKGVWKKKGVDEVSIKKFVTWSGSDEKIRALGRGEGGKPKQVKAFCSEPWFKLSVTWDGKVVPCCYDYNEAFVLGDLKVDSLKKIWNSEKVMALRRAVKQDALEKISLCKNCEDQINTSVSRYKPYKLRPRHFSYLLNRVIRR